MKCKKILIKNRFTIIQICVLMLLLFIPFLSWQPLQAAGATTSVHVVKYDADGNVLGEIDKTYEWLRDSLPVQGDGTTHYYHQGPVFEGDMWDPTETLNLKDKGAVKGTAFKDLCELVGGMSPGDEIMARAIDGWHTEFAYENIYEPLEQQGPITLCWYNGEDALSGESYGKGYPGNNAYYTAMQMVFLAGTTNVNGDHVFGNTDMKICLPDERYQHFYEGLASTNGLSGKWISEIAIFSGEAPVKPGEKLPATDQDASADKVPLLPVIFGVTGLVIIALCIIIIATRRKHN
jgi:hypothetical protein